MSARRARRPPPRLFRRQPRTVYSDGGCFRLVVVEPRMRVRDLLIASGVMSVVVPLVLLTVLGALWALWLGWDVVTYTTPGPLR